MKTADGRECPHYYADFYRGRNVQECRLAKDNPDSLRWHVDDCRKCPVPEILHANASRDMKLTLTIYSQLFGFFRRVKVDAYCTVHNCPIEDPFVGCRENHHPGLDIFRQALEQDDD